PRHRIPDLLRIDHNRRSPRALIEAAGGIGADAALEPLFVQEPLELVANGFGTLLGAAAFRIARLTPIGADENVSFEMWHGPSAWQSPPDHHALDLAGSFINAQRANVTVQPLGRRPGQKACAAVKLERLVDDALRGLGRKQLGHGRFALRALAAIVHSRRA